MSDTETNLRKALAQLPQYLRNAWDPLAPRDGADVQTPQRSEEELLLDLLERRCRESLLDRMHTIAESLSSKTLEWFRKVADLPRGDVPPSPQAPPQDLSTFLSNLLQEVNAPTPPPAENSKIPSVVQQFDSALLRSTLNPSDRTLLDSLRARVAAAETGGNRGAAIDVVARGADDALRLKGLARFLNRPAGSAAQEAATANWDGLADALGRATRAYMGDPSAATAAARAGFPMFSLIHIYWMDEGGVFWAAERLADRLHNGVVPSTAPLKGVRVPELSTAGRGIAWFSRAWRQGLLCAVSERSAQYSALYGYPLHIGGRTGRAQYVDALTTFSGSLNGALVRALQYYKDRRNTWIIADVTPARQSFDSLARVLDQGNENLRAIKPIEFRAQLEAIKVLLGGSNAANPSVIAREWRAALTPRPGVAERAPPWETVVDAVADRYSLRTVPVADYFTLAETGELLLFVVRLLHRAGSGIGSVDDGTFRAFLDLIEDWVQRYVAAYAAVTAIDLRSANVASTTLAEPPATHLAARYPPPAIGPLRDEWPKPVLAVR